VEELIRIVWPCSCPICRLLVHPFIRVIVHGLDLEKLEGEEVEEVVAEKIKEEKVEGKKVSQEELQELVRALKDTLVDLRAAISELTNPLNVMRRYGEMEELEAVRKAVSESTATPYPASAEVSESPQLSGVAEAKELRKPEEVVAKEERPAPERVEERAAKGVEAREVRRRREVEELAAVSAVPKLPKELSLIKLMKMFYMLREKLPSDLLRKYIDLMVSLGKVSEKESEVIKRILEIIDDSAWLGLSVDDQIVIMYILTKALGIKNEELEEELLGILTGKLRSIRGKARGEEDWGNQQQ